MRSLTSLLLGCLAVYACTPKHEAEEAGSSGSAGTGGTQDVSGAGGEGRVSAAGEGGVSAAAEAGSGGVRDSVGGMASAGDQGSAGDAAGAGGASDAPQGLDGAQVTLEVRNPIAVPISQKLTANVGPEVEFPTIENHALSGDFLAAADIDISSTQIQVLYHEATALLLPASTFNGYVFDFEPKLAPFVIRGLVVDPSSTADVIGAKLSFDEDTVRIDVAGLTVGSESRLVISILSSATKDPNAPFAGSWKGTLNQGANVFDYRMDLTQHGATVSGSSRIDLTPSYGIFSVTGTATSSALTFKEGSILEQQITQGYWCLKTGTLTLVTASPDTLTGSWTAPSCTPGTISLKRE